MGVSYHGDSGLILKHSGEIIEDVYGESSGTCVWQVMPERWDLLPGRGSEHPYAKWMKLERRKVVFSRGFWKVVVDYRGVNAGPNGNSFPAPQYELNRGSAEEPIETHEKFGEFAGKPSNPKNGAVFVNGRGEVTTDDDLGLFDRFKLTSDLRGVESYLAMTNISYTETWVTREMPSSGGKVKIDNPPGAPSFDRMRWLYVGMSSTGVRGGSCRNRKTWLLGMWKDKIYGRGN